MFCAVRTRTYIVEFCYHGVMFDVLLDVQRGGVRLNLDSYEDSSIAFFVTNSSACDRWMSSR